MYALVAVAGLVIVLGVAGCAGDGGGGGGGDQQLDLVIGNSVPLTGELSDFGAAGKKATNLAGAQITNAIEKSGADHTVKLVTKDSGSNLSTAVEAATELVDSGGATCITGAWASADTIATAQSVSIPGQILEISPASTADEITTLDDEGLLDRTVPPDSLQGPSLADAIADDLGGAEGRTVNIGARNDDYGTGVAGSFSDAWQDLGGEIGEEVIYEPEQPTYTSDASQMTEGAPDAFVIIDFPETFANVGPALQGTGAWDPSSAWSTAALASPHLPQDVGEEIVDGMRGITPGSPDESEAAAAFDALYEGADPNNVERQTFDSQQFDATILCYLAAVSAGSTNGGEMADALIDLTAPGGTEYTWQQLPEAIKALENGEDIDYTGVSGAIDMDENGDASAGVYDVYQFRGRHREIIGEVPVSTGE